MTYDDAKRLTVDGRVAFHNKKYDEAFRLFDAVRKGGFDCADAHIGYMFSNGLGVEKSIETAESIYREGASAGDILSQRYLAEILRNKGKFAEAVALYMELSKSGSPSANYWLYVFFQNGYGVEKNEHVAVGYLEKAAQSDHIYAARELTWRYLRGKYGFLGVFRGLYLAARGIITMTKTADDAYDRHELFH